jgi:hypothetical protein
MAAKKIMLLPIAKVLEGAAVDDEMPAGWLNSFYERARKMIPNDEWGSAKIRGASKIYISYEHSLSSEEETRVLLADATERAERVRSMLPRDGEGLTAEQVDQIRQLLR